ncbi:MAG: hypothetical protein UX80_C0001G0051 [Candidatus Amesbacteria bacterium GW2011_GWA2_47_11b]|uniref:Uncharacterized protein n=3 Tax=Candidatus Amesiibacteriota TaxID=1752730 RepID=A0A0G1VFH0_9BACT|nr:MAG: hypothetical protein UX42_C0016G0022 [Microgenomates group bacterium GW2011_GWC1_46_20]KKU58612.1 MAG: hypothetical protein UX80_C0001G0051 [Candidatus Amesbacteria bacterium GW2011_GWA2_47_11b]KKU68760.1 MAG: hypothetical protein UX92_C0018G0008 [Candidatus Amesbacteria bacterium GW2011_GWA1_47_20]KKU83755.1 MAG: hypothetical protein UY11_C0014G0011 [Candidatus Amesbacteria bacterium GW2011_GWC2_47_8]
MNKWLPIASAVVALGISAGIVLYFKGKPNSPLATPTPIPDVAVQLAPDKQPQIELKFSSDGHYVTVSLSNLNANQLEYNLIYDAMVKSSKLQTGVNATANISGKSIYSQKQLLGSESSGKFSYHEKITNAVMELALRDSSGRSIFTATYPFTVKAGSSSTLTPSE